MFALTDNDDPDQYATTAGGRSTARGGDRGGHRPRRSRAAVDVPLGSLTQPQHRHRQTCRDCGSERVTRLAMRLTDGTPVDFVSCHRCENRMWEHDGVVLDVETVLDRTRKIVA